jgi:thioredoxin-dependent peroxiredoxin
MAKTPEIGVTAPDFTLPSLDIVDGVAQRTDRTLSAERGRPVVLAFYPGDDTTVCTKQMCAYTNDLEQFTKLNALVWGISTQDLDSHERFARKHGIGFPLLADVKRTVTGAYGVSGFGLGARRSVFVVDGEGVVRWKFVGLVGVTFPAAATIASHIPA